MPMETEEWWPESAEFCTGAEFWHFWAKKFSNKNAIKTIKCRILTSELLHSAEFPKVKCRIWKNISGHPGLTR